MKQAELNKLLNLVLKQSGKANGWECSRGFVFKATELLFFAILSSGQVKQRFLRYMLVYKLLAFDDLFWKIVKLEENRKQPLSFHASGVWTAPMMTILEADLSIAEWNEENVRMAANDVITRCGL